MKKYYKTIKILLFLLLFSVCSSFVFGALPPINNVSLAITCDADERNSSHVYDSSDEEINGKYGSSIKFVPGIIGDACNFTGHNDVNNRIGFGNNEKTNFNTDTSNNGNCISWIGRLGTVTASFNSRSWFANGVDGNRVYCNDANNEWYSRTNGGNTYGLTTKLKEQSVGWSHFVWCYRANKRQLWVNGSAVSNSTANYIYTTNENFYLGNHGDGTRGIDAQMDEITIFYNTFLLGDQVQSLYEALFNGYGYKDGWQLVTASLGGIVNGSRHNTLIENSLNFSVEVGDNFLYANCTLQKFNSSGFFIQEVDTFNYSVPQIFWVNDSNFTSSTEQEFKYNVICSFEGNTVLSNNISVIVDNVNPFITFSSNKINEDNSSFVLGDTAAFNVTFFDTYLYRTRINVTTPTNNTVYFNDSGVLSGSDTTYLVNATFLLNDAEETYNIFLVATDTHTKKKIKKYDLFMDKINKKHNYITEYNNIISVELLNKKEKVDLLSIKEIDRHIFGYRFNENKERILDIQVSCDNKLDFLSKSKFSAHFICAEKNGFGGNWIDFEGQKVLGVKRLDNNNYVVKTKVKGQEIKFNSLGGLNVINKTITFQRKVTNHSFYFSDPIIYSDITVINQSMIMEVLGVYYSNNPIANITFNGTVYNAIKRTNTTPNNYNFSFIVNLPTINTSLFNDTFNFWGNYSFNGYYYGSNIQQQFLYIPSVFVCNSLSDDRILNLTYRDEISNNIIVTNNSYNLDFTDNFINYSFVGSFVNNRSSEYCTNIRPTESYNWGYSGTFTLSKPNYITRILTIPSTPITIASNNPITYRNLYLIKTNDSSTITFTWQTTEYQYIDGTMIIYKCEDNGSKSIVESVPIISGEAIANLQLLFTPYSYEVIIDGVTYTNIEGWTGCHVESSTTRTFFVDTSKVDVLPVVGLYFVDCVLEKIDNNTVSMEWNSNKEDSGYIQGCLLTKQMQLDGYITIGRSCVNSSTGNFTRDISGSGNYLVIGEITQNGIKGYCKNEISFYNKSEFLDSSGPLTLFGVVLLIASLVGIYAANGEKMVFACVFGLILSFFLGVLAFSWEIVFSLICFLLIIVLIGRYARKKE